MSRATLPPDRGTASEHAPTAISPEAPALVATPTAPGGMGPGPDNRRAALWMLGAAVLFSLMAAGVKLLGSRLDSFQIAFFRCFFGLMLIAPAILRGGVRATFDMRRATLHLARAGTGVFAIGCFFWALTRAPLADVTAISFASPLAVTVLALVVLREQVRWQRWVATIVGFGGVLVMLGPQGRPEPALLVALAGTVAVAVSVVMVKKMASTETTLTMLAWFAGLATVAFLPLAVSAWTPPTVTEWLLLVAVGCLGVTAQSCLIRAYRGGEASAVAPIDYTRLLFATALGVVVFGQWPSPGTLLGAPIIVGSALYIARSGSRHRTPA